MRQTAFIRGSVFLVAIVAWGAPLGDAFANDVRIVAVDGRMAVSGRETPVKVRPGQVVSLTADEVWEKGDGTIEYAYRPVEDFTWTADISRGEVCDPEVGCVANTNFEVTEYGVNYYVPWDAPYRIVVTARFKWGDGAASVRLINEHANRGARRPYWDEFLDGLGYWIMLGGRRVFVPVHYVESWAPYRHGRWYWSVHGWTWHSYDPWGYVTDHCGHWRHSIAYGWVWIPEAVCVWRPAVVAFFHGPSWIGWYPFDPGWSWGYRHGYAAGFDDGFWMGYAVSRRTGRKGRLHVFPGISVVEYKHFHGPAGPSPRAHGKKGQFKGIPARSMSNLVLYDAVAANAAFHKAMKMGHVGPVPGGGKDPAAGRKFIARKTGAQPETVEMRPAWNDGDGRHGKDTRLLKPEGRFSEKPARYRGLDQRIRAATDNGRGRGVGVRVSRVLGDTGVSEAGTGRAERKGAAVQPRSTRSGSVGRQMWEPGRRAAGEDRKKPAVSPSRQRGKAGSPAGSAARSEWKSRGSSQRRKEIRRPAEPSSKRDEVRIAPKPVQRPSKTLRRPPEPRRTRKIESRERRPSSPSPPPAHQTVRKTSSRPTKVESRDEDNRRYKKQRRSRGSSSPSIHRPSPRPRIKTQPNQGRSGRRRGR